MITPSSKLQTLTSSGRSTMTSWSLDIAVHKARCIFLFHLAFGFDVDTVVALVLCTRKDEIDWDVPRQLSRNCGEVAVLAWRSEVSRHLGGVGRAGPDVSKDQVAMSSCKVNLWHVLYAGSLCLVLLVMQWTYRVVAVFLKRKSSLFLFSWLLIGPTCLFRVTAA
jgi:hypothetical protein